MSDDGRVYIWVCRWPDFQHYPLERDRPPAWIKAYTKQHDDDAYRDLSMGDRGLLHDLRIAFPRARYQLSMNTRSLSHRLGQRVTTPQLERLNQAGFIEFVSRATLEERLEQLYSRVRPRTRGEGEVDKEPPLPPHDGGAVDNKDLVKTHECPVCGVKPHRRGLADHLIDVHLWSPAEAGVFA